LQEVAILVLSIYADVLLASLPVFPNYRFFIVFNKE